MRIIVCLFAVSMIAITIVFCFLPADFVAKYVIFTRREQVLCLLDGLGLNTPAADIGTSVGSSDTIGGESAGSSAVNDNNTNEGIISDEGEMRQTEQEIIDALAIKLQSLPRTENGETDYKALCFTDRMNKITEYTFTPGEVEYIFSKVVRLSTVAVPVSGVLTKFTLVDNTDTLEITAEINLDLRGIIKKYKLTLLPQFASFTVVVPLGRKNGVINAKNEDITLNCTSFNLPNSMLTFGCNMAFGKADYHKKLGDTVSNILNNLDF